MKHTCKWSHWRMRRLGHLFDDFPASVAEGFAEAVRSDTVLSDSRGSPWAKKKREMQVETVAS